MGKKCKETKSRVCTRRLRAVVLARLVLPRAGAEAVLEAIQRSTLLVLLLCSWLQPEGKNKKIAEVPKVTCDELVAFVLSCFLLSPPAPSKNPQPRSHGTAQ